MEFYRGMVWVNVDEARELLAEGKITGPHDTLTIEKNDIILRGTGIERTVTEAIQLAKQKGYPIISCIDSSWRGDFPCFLSPGIARYTYEFYDVKF